MTSFITTMFVSSSPSSFSPQFPPSPKPLPPVFTPTSPQDCLHRDSGGHERPINRLSGYDDPFRHRRPQGFSPLASSGDRYSSPLQKAFCEALKTNLHSILHIQPPPVMPGLNSYESHTRAHKRPRHGYTDFQSIYSSNNRVGRTGNGGTAAFRAKEGRKGTGSWQLKQFAEATLGSGSLRKAVQLPEGEDLGEWLAVNVVDFYNQINLLYGSITEFCSPQSCPEMKATDEFEYLWQDDTNYRRPTKMPAPQYIEHLMSWVQSNIDNEAMFPSRIGVSFPKQFPSLIRQLFKRLYRVYAHIYCHHYPVIVALGLEPHLNTSFKHYILFVDEHSLNQGSRDFWGPLGDLVENMLKGD